MRIARLVVTQERLRQVLGLPRDAVVMVASVEITGTVDFLIHSQHLSDQLEGSEPLRVSSLTVAAKNEPKKDPLRPMGVGL